MARKPQKDFIFTEETPEVGEPLWAKVITIDDKIIVLPSSIIFGVTPEVIIEWTFDLI